MLRAPLYHQKADSNEPAIKHSRRNVNESYKKTKIEKQNTENTLLDNIILLQGLQEDPLELDSNRME